MATNLGSGGRSEGTALGGAPKARLPKAGRSPREPDRCAMALAGCLCAGATGDTTATDRAELLVELACRNPWPTGSLER